MTEVSKAELRATIAEIMAEKNLESPKLEPSEGRRSKRTAESDSTSSKEPRSDPLMEADEWNLVPPRNSTDEFQTDAQLLLEILRDFTTKHNMDPAILLQNLSDRLLGPEHRYTATREFPPPFPDQHSVDLAPPFPEAPAQFYAPPSPTTGIPGQALITWGKMAGQEFSALHQDLAYVKWLLDNRRRYEQKPEAAQVLTYLDQTYVIEGSGAKSYLKKIEQDGAAVPLRLPRRTAPPRVGLAQPPSEASSSTASGRLPAIDLHTQLLVQALLNRLRPGEQ